MLDAARGVHPLYLKELTDKKQTERLPAPERVYIPLLQHTGAACQPTVAVSEKVKVGSLLGKSDKFISAPVHSSVSGTVVSIERRVHPVLGFAQSVEIENDGTDECGAGIQERQNVDSLSPDELRRIINESGVVGLGGAAFPTYVKLSPPKEKKIDTVILNGVECEPYLTCDHRIMVERTRDVMNGLLLILKILGVNRAYIAIEANKPDAISRMRKTISELQAKRTPDSELRVIVLKVKYPQGAEKQLIKTVLNREVPSGGLPMDVGVLVNNVGTALAVYEAVKFGKPLYERVVTVTGAVNEPKNLLVRVGTPIKSLIEFCGGYSETPGKIIMGGPMMGVAQRSADAPVIKGTCGILVLTQKESRPQKISPCIRCARCVDACPVNLLPCAITVAAEFGKYEIAREYSVFDCIECGACAWVCPSKRPMVHLIKDAKLQLKR